MVSMYKTGKLPISEAEIDEVQAFFGVTFPSDYREFMLKNNGGILDGASSFKCNNGFASCVGWFYRIEKESNSDIRDANELRDGRLPAYFVSIGTDGGGDEICIDCRSGEGFGRVYYWDHNFEAHQEHGMTPEEAGNYHLIANSFSEFLDCLYEQPMPSDEEIATDVIDTSTPEMKSRMQALMKRKGLL